MSMIPAAELRAKVTMLGVKKANAEAMSFHGTLKSVSGESAEASLKANYEGRGFDEFKVAMTDAKLRAAKPIVQEAKLKYDKGAFSDLRREIFLTHKAMGGIGGGGGLGSALSGAVMPFGKIGTAAVAASGPVLSLAGGLTAVAGSAVGAAEGAGALGIAAGGVAAVGIGGLMAVAAPAVLSLKALTEAQKSYIAAVETYGVQSTQAETAGKKLQAAERMAGKEAVGVVKGLDQVKERWESITKPGREAFLGGLSDAIDRVDKKLPMLGASANRSAQVGRKGFDQFLGQVTGSDFDKFVKTMTNTEETIVPELSNATGDWGVILERVATDAAPSLEKVTGIFSHWSKEVLGSTANSHKLSGDIEHLTGDFMDWVHLLGASGSLLHDIFDAGEGSGNELVVATTKQFQEWGVWIDTHRSDVVGFFHETEEGVKALASILGHTGKDWFVMAQAMEPVETEALKILDEFAKIHIGGQSMLTYLLGGFALLKVAVAAVKIKDLYEGIGWLRTLTKDASVQTERETGALQAQADAASAAAGANSDLAASNQAVADSAQLSMLETGPVADAEKAGQLSMFPMGAGLSTVEKEAAMTPAAVGGASKLGMLGKASMYAGAGVIGGQVAGGMVGGKAGGILSAAGAGAGIGAAVGTVFPEFGGPVTGALAGAGIAVAAKGIADLLTKEKQLTPLQKALKSDAQHAADAFRNQRDAAHGLTQAESTLEASQRRHRDSTQGVTKAHREMNQAVRQFGPDSQQAHQAELNLAKAQKRDAESAEEVKNAYKLTRNERQRDRLAITESVAANKQLIPNLSSVVGHLKEQHDANQHNVPLLERLIEKEQQLSKAVRTLGSDYAQAEQVGSKSWVKSLETMSTAQASYGHNLKGLLRELPSLGSTAHASFLKAETSAEQLQHKFGHFTDVFKEHTVAPYKEDTKSLSTATHVSFASIDKEAEKLLFKFGVSSSTFGANTAGPPPPQRKQEGGFLVGGTGSGDRPGFMGEPKGFVLNRNATSTFGFAKGGMIPLALEPGERYFSPPEAQRIGPHNLAAMNAAVPRFQKGGALGPEPQITGPSGSLRDIGQDAVAQVHKGAAEYLAAHKPKGGAGALDVSGLGGTRFDIGAAELKQIHAPHIVSLALFEALLDEGGPFSNVLEGEGAGTGAPIMSAAREISGFLTGHPTWTGTTAMGLANSGEQAYEIAQDVQASGAGLASHGRDNYGKQQAAAESLLRTYGLAAGGSVPPPGRKRDWKWPLSGAQHLITGGEALGVPTEMHPSTTSSASSSTPAANGPIADATAVVGWMKRRLGEGPTVANGGSANPTEWCGDALGKDMLEHGINPPSGYALASAWGSWGTSATGPAFGNVVVIGGSGHVGLSLGGNQMISGNFSDTIAESTIGEAAGGRPITGYRTPPYSGGKSGRTKAEEIAGTYKEHVPNTFNGVYANKTLSIGASTPKTMAGIKKEITRRTSELGRYRRSAALATHENKPAIAHAIGLNVTVLETRLSQLRKAASKLRRSIAEKHFGANVSHGLGNVTGYEKLILAKQDDYTEKSEIAQAVVELEPTEPILASNATEAQREAAEKAYVGTLTGYIESQERPAYAAVIGSEADWRNTILGAELYGIGGKTSASLFEDAYEKQIRQTDNSIDAINAYTEKVGQDEQKLSEDIATYRSNHPKGELPQWIQEEQQTVAGEEKRRDKMRAHLPTLRYKDETLRGALGGAREEFYPGVKNPISPPTPPLPYTGTFETDLDEVQGMHQQGMHSLLSAAQLAAPRNALGLRGVIGQTQGEIEALGLQVQQAQASIMGAAPGSGSGTEAGNTERDELLETLLHQANEEKLVRNIEVQTLGGGLPYMGAFAKGGVALVGERGPEIAAMPSGTRIRSAEDTRSLLQPSVVINHYEAEDRYEVEINGEKVKADIRREQRRGARRAARGLARAGS
jgi:hypothetical protein